MVTTARTEESNPRVPDNNGMMNDSTISKSGGCSTVEASSGHLESGSLSTPVENQDVDGRDVRMESFVEKHVREPVLESSTHL